jgi:hypothetical protein
MSRVQNLFSTPHASFHQLKQTNYLPSYRILFQQLLADPDFKSLAKEDAEKNDSKNT